MEYIVLITADFAAYLLFIYKCFSLMEGMLNGKHYSLLFRLTIGIFNAALMVNMALNIPVNLAYLITILLLYLELLVVFRKPLKDTLFVALVVMMNIMCLRGIVISFFALVINGTLYEVCSTPHLFLSVLFISNILEWLALFVIMHFFRMEGFQYTMHNKTQSRFIIIWASLCVLFMFRSSEVYIRDYSLPNMFIDHMSYSFMLLLSFYFLLIYTFRLNKAAKISEINKSLSQELGNQIELQSALTRDAIYTSKANLSQNNVISGKEIYGDPFEHLHCEYDAWFEYARSKIHPDDHEIFSLSLERQKLIDNFNLGIEPKPLEYRHSSKDNDYHWVRLVLRMFKDVQTDDVYLFGYAFDVDNEVHNRQALLLSAQTDLFTGLYNKATTQTLIGEEIRKGAGFLLLLDIDDFKYVNDSFGHEAGDYVLKYVADLLKSTFRKCDVVGRVGGDEFMIYIKDTTDISIAEDRAAELLKQLKTGVDFDKIRIIVSVSIGITVIDEKNDSFSVAYNQADSALYLAKQNGKNKYYIYSNSDECSAC